MRPTIVEGGRIFDPSSGLDGPGDLVIDGDGRVAAVGPDAAATLQGDADRIDARGLAVLPGLPGKNHAGRERRQPAPNRWRETPGYDQANFSCGPFSKKCREPRKITRPVFEPGVHGAHQYPVL